MSIQYEYAPEGYEYRPTELGAEEGRIANKYRDTYHSKQYRKAVPKKWITNGWVKYVKVEAEK